MYPGKWWNRAYAKPEDSLFRLAFEGSEQKREAASRYIHPSGLPRDAAPQQKWIDTATNLTPAPTDWSPRK